MRKSFIKMITGKGRPAALAAGAVVLASLLAVLAAAAQAPSFLAGRVKTVGVEGQPLSERVDQALREGGRGLIFTAYLFESRHKIHYHGEGRIVDGGDGLPEGGDGAPGRMLPSQAIGSVERLPESREPRASILDRLPALEDLPSFRRVPNLVDTAGDPSRFLSDMAATFAGAYLRSAAPETTIALVHAVTGPSAVRLLIPYLPAETIRRMLRYAWQAAAAVYASWARSAPEDLPPAEPADRDKLVDRAVETGDEHAIKFVEACLREHAIAPAPDLLAAARDAVARLRAFP